MPCTKPAEGAAPVSDSTRSAQRCTGIACATIRYTHHALQVGAQVDLGRRDTVGATGGVTGRTGTAVRRSCWNRWADTSDLDLLDGGRSRPDRLPRARSAPQPHAPGRKVIDHPSTSSDQARCETPGAPGCLARPTLTTARRLGLGGRFAGQITGRRRHPRVPAALHEISRSPRHLLGQCRVLGLQDRHSARSAFSSVRRVLGQTTPERSALHATSPPGRTHQDHITAHHR